MAAKSDWNVAPSKFAQDTVNPIRRLVDTMKLTTNPDKELIRLSIGDPTVFGNLVTSDESIEAVIEAARSRGSNGYPNAAGSEVARQAVADYVSQPNTPITFQDVILTSGCSQSLEIAMTLLANPGDTILIPRPGFSLYKTLGDSLKIGLRYYDLTPERSWEIDLRTLESQIDASVRAVIVNSPSNPCGSVFSKEHIKDIIEICERYKIPIISDDVYAHVVFDGHTHYSFAELSDDVPVLSVSAISKRFLVPGWRLGWLIVHDKAEVLSKELRSSLTSLTQRTLGPCSLIQAALPRMLKDTSIFESCNQLYEILASTPGLKPIKPTGAMYMMVGIEIARFPKLSSDVDFTENLIAEQSVFCLPAKCFAYPNYFRIVLCLPTEKIAEACERIKAFCELHYQ